MNAKFQGLHSAAIAAENRLQLVPCTFEELQQKGCGITIFYALIESLFGPCFVAASARGICSLEFDTTTALTALQKHWPKAQFEEDRLPIKEMFFRLHPTNPFSLLGNNPVQPNPNTPDSEVPNPDKLGNRSMSACFPQTIAATQAPIPIWIPGTPFQRQVWETLLKIPFGNVVSYSELATQAGCPTAIRAVASAVARNPVSYLIPCHRVIRQNGETGQYRWGAARKTLLLSWEHEIASRIETPF